MCIIAGICLSSQPTKVIELLKYMKCVKMGSNSGAVGWREYDVQYRLRNAHNPASSRGDSGFWLMYMSPISTFNDSHTLHGA